MSLSAFDRWLTSQPEAPECPQCEGTGEDDGERCTMCDGTGIRSDDYDDGRAEDPWH